MIKVENLRKVYVSSSNNKCEALKGISFTLPQTGMVFICGKSGSGKSTLLNILGGLDKFTSGDIEMVLNFLISQIPIMIIIEIKMLVLYFKTFV